MTRLADATAALGAPLAALDLAAFDANAADLARRAGGLPVRVASKSLRCRDALTRVLALPGFSGVMAYALPEALWLVGHGLADVFVAYPTVDRDALARLAADEAALAAVSLAVDSVEHVEFLAAALRSVAELAFVNGGGTGSLETFGGDGSVTAGGAAPRARGGDALLGRVRRLG